jgi:hypothetical protein
MGNPHPSNGFKKGHRRIDGSGRKPGTPNKTTQNLKDALLIAAERLGHIHETPKLDAKGKPTGEVELSYDGEEGTVGYLMWLGMHNPKPFAGLLGRVLPLQVNAKTEQRTTRVAYRTVAEVKQALIERGMRPEVVDAIEAAMQPKFNQEQKKKEELRAALRERGIDPDILEAPPDVLAAIGLKFLEDKKPDPVQ